MPPKSKSHKKCPPGVWCADNTTVGLLGFILVILVAIGSMWQQVVQMNHSSAFLLQQSVARDPANPYRSFSAFTANSPLLVQQVRPDVFPEPTRDSGYGRLPQIRNRGQNPGPYTQVGILTGAGGSSSSAAPDRTILPLFGRELDPRKSKWNYYTRTDGTNPVQVPVRVGNRVCDDDRNGCNEVYSNDTVHVPALGRAFTATVYRVN